MLNDKDRAEKHLRALQRELDRLERRSRHPPVHALIPPIQRGWKRHFVLTLAASQRPDAAVLEEILVCLNAVRYFWRPDFRFTRRQRRRHRGLVAVEQELMAIHWQDWERGPLPPAWQKYFRRKLLQVERLRAWPSRHEFQSYERPWAFPTSRQHDWGYEFRHPSWFELKVEKHWLTHYSEIEPGVEGRIAEIERWMSFHGGHARLLRLKGRTRWWLRHDDAAHRRCERQLERELRAHLGFLSDEAADHISSDNRAGGRGGWDVISRLVVDRTLVQIFCGSDDWEYFVPYQHFRQGPSALSPRGRTFVGSRGALPHGTGAP